MNFRSNYFLLFSLILIFTACQKSPDNAPPADPRDKIVGEYQVWDTLYKYTGTDSSGKIIHDKVAVFHYTKVSIVKNIVTYYTSLGSDERDGLTYTVLETDASITGKNGEKEGYFGYKADFVIGNSNPVTLSGTEYIIGQSKNGELKNGYLHLTGGEFMSGYSSARAVKIK